MIQAVRWGLIAVNPCTAVEGVRVEEKDLVLWEPDQVVRVLEHAASHPTMNTAVTLALATGMRRSELLGARWQDLKRGGLHICQTCTATQSGAVRLRLRNKSAKSSRRVPLDPETLAVLEAHRQSQATVRAERPDWQDHDLIFPNTIGTPWNPHNFRRSWCRLLEDLDVPYIHIHALRNTYISLANYRGIDVMTISDRVGHANPAFTLRGYAKVFAEQREGGAVPLSQLVG